MAHLIRGIEWATLSLHELTKKKKKKKTYFKFKFQLKLESPKNSLKPHTNF